MARLRLRLHAEPRVVTDAEGAARCADANGGKRASALGFACAGVVAGLAAELILATGRRRAAQGRRAAPEGAKDLALRGAGD